MRALIACGSAALAALILAVAAAGAPKHVTCPLAPGTPSGGDVQWAFTDSARPSAGAVTSSYVHGRGSWTSGRAIGTACSTDAIHGHGGRPRDLVLGIGGRSKLTGHVTQGGLLGVRIVLPVKVRASDDSACRTGATGTVTLFASYYSVHRDTMKVKFGAHCTGHNLSYASPGLRVYIARGGAQVNTP